MQMRQGAGIFKKEKKKAKNWMLPILQNAAILNCKKIKVFCVFFLDPICKVLDPRN